jgi:hypothetical protein
MQSQSELEILDRDSLVVPMDLSAGFIQLHQVGINAVADDARLGVVRAVGRACIDGGDKRDAR